MWPNKNSTSSTLHISSRKAQAPIHGVPRELQHPQPIGGGWGNSGIFLAMGIARKVKHGDPAQKQRILRGFGPMLQLLKNPKALWVHRRWDGEY